MKTLIAILLYLISSCSSIKPKYKIIYLESSYHIFCDTIPKKFGEDVSIYKLTKTNYYKLVKTIPE